MAIRPADPSRSAFLSCPAVYSMGFLARWLHIHCRPSLFTFVLLRKVMLVNFILSVCVLSIQFLFLTTFLWHCSSSFASGYASSPLPVAAKTRIPLHCLTATGTSRISWESCSLVHCCCKWFPGFRRDLSSWDVWMDFRFPCGCDGVV